MVRKLLNSIVVSAVAVSALAAGPAAMASSAPSVSYQCDPVSADAVVVHFGTNGAQAALWSVVNTETGEPVTFGETDNLPGSSKWTQALAIEPDTTYRAYLQTADLGERLEYSWEWVNVQEASAVFECSTPEPVAEVTTTTTAPATDEVVDSAFLEPKDPEQRTANPVISDEFYRPTPSPYTFWAFIRDVYLRAIIGRSDIIPGYQGGGVQP